MPSTLSLFADAEVISTYTRADALADGDLVDVSETAAEAGIRYPTAMTRAAWAMAVEWTRDAGLQDERGRLWDVVWMLRNAMKRASGSELTFTVLVVPNVRGARLPKSVELRAVCGPGDTEEPVVTIMLPLED